MSAKPSIPFRSTTGDYPEIQAGGESPELAAAQLVNRLSRVLDTAPDRWRNESIQSAIADIQALIARDA